MKSKTSYLWLILFVFIIVSFLYARNRVTSKRELILSKGEKSIGIVYETQGEYLKCKYQVNGVSFVFGQDVPYQYLEDGEQYEIKFLTKDPEYIIIEFDKPILSDEFVFIETSPTQIENVDSRLFRFRYTVNDREYTRLTFSEGKQSISQNYKVKFRKDNPQIGYLIEIHQ